jgi:hypothetical protein
VLTQADRQTRGDVSMPAARGLAHDEATTDELRTLVRNARVQQLLSRHQQGHVGNVSGLTRHSNQGTYDASTQDQSGTLLTRESRWQAPRNSTAMKQ